MTRPLAARRTRGVGFAVGFVAIVAGVLAVVLAVVLIGPAGHHVRTALGRTPPPTGTVVPTPVAAGGGDTVFCGRSSCRQAGRTVLVPIEGGSCIRDRAGGSWIRLDGGALEPMLICLPAANLPRAAVSDVVVVPTLIGGRLDHVEAALDRLGIPYRTSGGGLFGIVSSSNWTICATRPSAGAGLPRASEVTVFVEHRC